MVHMASVWVPFTSESKEAVASYPEIQKRLRLAIQTVGRKLGLFLRRRLEVKAEGERRSIFLRYLGEVADAVSDISDKEQRARRPLQQTARSRQKENRPGRRPHSTNAAARSKIEDDLANDKSVLIIPQAVAALDKAADGIGARTIQRLFVVACSGEGDKNIPLTIFANARAIKS